jgi:hypothetical protein
VLFFGTSESSNVYVILALLQFVPFQHIAPVAQLDRAMVYETIGREFEPLRAHHLSSGKTRIYRQRILHSPGVLQASVIKVS